MIVKEEDHKAYRIEIRKLELEKIAVTHTATIFHRNSGDILSELSTDDKENPLRKLLLASQGVIDNRRMLKNSKG